MAATTRELRAFSRRGSVHAKRVERLRRAHVDAAVGKRRRRVGVFGEIVDRLRRQIAARRDHDDGAGLGGEEDVAVGGDRRREVRRRARRSGVPA